MVDVSATTWICEHEPAELGFAMAGVVRAEKFPELARQQEWLARGYAGEMNYLSDTRRSDPQAAFPGIQSAIVCALTYNTEHRPNRTSIRRHLTMHRTDRWPPRLDLAIFMGR